MRGREERRSGGGIRDELARKSAPARPSCATIRIRGPSARQTARPLFLQGMNVDSWIPS